MRALGTVVQAPEHSQEAERRPWFLGVGMCTCRILGRQKHGPDPSSPALGKTQEKGLGEIGIWKWAEQGLTGSRQGNVWNLGVGWQRMELLPRVWKILGNWGKTKELASSPTAGQRDSQKAPLPLCPPLLLRVPPLELDLPGGLV